MVEGALATALIIGLACLWIAWSRIRARQAALELLEPAANLDQLGGGLSLGQRPFARRHYLLPWLAACGCGAALILLARIPWPFALTLSFVVGLLGGQCDAWWLQVRGQRIENQLADAIGLMIGAVNVGASLQAALENTLQESRPPLRPILETVVGRIRYGDDPQAVMQGLRQQVPLETFQLFATTLAVNWRVGGSLAQTLAKVERTVRDRIETGRRIQAMTTQTRVSVIGVLCVTYFIAALVWRNNPQRMAGFLTAPLGQWLAACAIALQGIGIVWISWMSRPRF